MKVLSVSLFNNPKGQGGIESFNRALKYIFGEKLKIIIYDVKKQKLIYEVKDIIEIGSTSIFFRVINKILKNKLREYLLIRKVKKLAPDTIIFSYPYEVKILSNIRGKKILVQHTSWEKYLDIYCNGGRLKTALKEKIDYFIALSPYDKEVFCKGLDLNKEKVKVIRHSSEVKLLQTKKEKNKKLIMVARIDNNSKRFDLAIKAMRKLSDYTLDIYGSGSDIEYCKKIIKEREINNVFLKGSTNKVQEKLDESGIFIMTSDYEGYPISTIEAMRRGLPIILRNTFNSARDIVIDNGVLLEKKWDEDKFVKAVKKVYDNYEYYSENSKKNGRRYNTEVIKKEWDKLLKEIGEN